MTEVANQRRQPVDRHLKCQNTEELSVTADDLTSNETRGRPVAGLISGEIYECRAIAFTVPRRPKDLAETRLRLLARNQIRREIQFFLDGVNDVAIGIDQKDVTVSMLFLTPMKNIVIFSVRD